MNLLIIALAALLSLGIGTSASTSAGTHATAAGSKTPGAMMPAAPDGTPPPPPVAADVLQGGGPSH